MARQPLLLLTITTAVTIVRSDHQAPGSSQYNSCPWRPFCQEAANHSLTAPGLADPGSTPDLLSACCQACDCTDNCQSPPHCCPLLLQATAGMVIYSYSPPSLEANQYSEDRFSTYVMQQYTQNMDVDTLDTDGTPTAQIWTRGTCVKFEITSRHIKDQGFSFFAISACPEDYLDDAGTVMGCEEQDGSTFDKFLPVTSSYTNILYKNKFCLLCNEQNSTWIPWQAALYCHQETDMALPGVAQPSDLLQFVLDQPHCSISFQPMEGDFQYLSSFLCVQSNTASCNATQPTCKIITSAYDYDDNSVFYDSFACDQCRNTSSSDGSSFEAFHESCMLSQLDFGNQTTSVVLNVEEDVWRYVPVFDLSREELSGSRQDRCGQGKLLDHTSDQCRETYCPRDHSTMKDYCLPVFTQIKDMSISLKLKIKFERFFFAQIIEDMNQYITEAFTSFFRSYGISICKSYIWHKYKDDSQTDFDFFFIYVVLYTREEIHYVDIWMTVRQLVQGKPLGEIPDLENNKVDYLIRFADSVSMETEDGVMRVIDYQDGQQLVGGSSQEQDVFGCKVSISMGSTSFCERVALDEGEYDIYGRQLILKHSTDAIAAGRYDPSFDGKVFICTEDYKKRKSKKSEKVKVSDINNLDLDYDQESEGFSTNFSFFLGIIVTTVSICSIFLVAGLIRKQCFGGQRARHITMSTIGREVQEIA